MELPVDIRVPATAGFCMTAPEKLADHDSFFAAGALAAPQCLSVPAAGALKHGQSTERLSRYIDGSGHGDLRTGC
jgi:hypothetical protein